MAIDTAQLDSAMRPLTSFLFKCSFSANSDDGLLSEDLIKRLNYSVHSFSVPKMREMNGKSISFGSFSIPFPYYSTGEMDLMIDFYEQDDMLLSRFFYILQNKNRWKASTLFEYSNADIFVTLEIYDQRNSIDYLHHVLYKRTYALKMKKMNPPEFQRTSDPMPGRLSVEFNSLQQEYSGYGLSDDELNRYANEMYKWDKEDDVAIMNVEQLGDTLVDFTDSLSQIAGIDYSKPFGQMVVYKDQRDLESSNYNLKTVSENLGFTSKERMLKLNDSQESIDSLREALIAENVNVKDYSEVYEALTEMGVLSRGTNHYCQLGVSIVDSIVSGKERVKAKSASTSVSKWKEAGYDVAETKKFETGKDTKTDVDSYIGKLIKTGKVREGDKVVISYDEKNEKPGHIVTILYDEKRKAEGKSAWYTGSDFIQRTNSGIPVDQRVDRAIVLKKRDN